MGSGERDIRLETSSRHHNGSSANLEYKQASGNRGGTLPGTRLLDRRHVYGSANGRACRPRAYSSANGRACHAHAYTGADSRADRHSRSRYSNA